MSKTSKQNPITDAEATLKRLQAERDDLIVRKASHRAEAQRRF